MRRGLKSKPNLIILQVSVALKKNVTEIVGNPKSMMSQEDDIIISWEEILLKRK